MRIYWIFAICLTVAYIIYYAVNIVRDLYGKKDGNPSGEETFEVDYADEQETSVSVAESETGFSIGDETFETNIASEEHDDDNKEDEVDREKRAQAEFDRKKAQFESEMEEARPCLSDAYDQHTLRMALVNKGISGNRPALKWTSSIDRL